MKSTRQKLSKYDEVYCINCHVVLSLSLSERRGDIPIICPKCKESFSIKKAEKFIESISLVKEGGCPSCKTILTFSLDDRIGNKMIKCPTCKEQFYIDEVLNPRYEDIQVGGSIKSHSKDNQYNSIQKKKKSKDSTSEYKNKLASIALTISIISAFFSLEVIYFLIGTTGAILGIIALYQIRETGERGKGMAISAIIVGSMFGFIKMIVNILVDMGY